MKIFRLIPDNKNLEESFDKEIPLQVLPDTALLIQKRPFFIPDFTQNCTAQICCALRINRLGRSINERFAHRYYDADAVTLGVHFVARDLYQQLKSEGKPCDIAVGFDNAVAVSEKKTSHFVSARTATLNVAGTTYTAAIRPELFKVMDQQISNISSYYTLKQGDLILFPLAVDEVQVQIDNHVTMSLDDDEVLAFNVK